MMGLVYLITALVITRLLSLDSFQATQLGGRLGKQMTIHMLMAIRFPGLIP